MAEAAASPVVLVDASGWLFRAFHALPPLTDTRGRPTGAVYGMLNMLRKLLRSYRPEHIAVVFDAPGKTFRETLYEQYKANRDETPEDLRVQFPVVTEIVQAMGLPLLAVPGVEADDVIGTLTVQARAAGHPVLIVTSDKDLAQLVDDDVALLDTMKDHQLDRHGVEKKFGVPPSLIVDYLALVGDSSDNIPGVPLVGPKTAAKWLSEYGSLDSLVAHSQEVKGKAGENLRAHLRQLPLARELATIRRDVALPFGLEDLLPRPADRARLGEMYRELGFRRLLEELGSAADPDPEDPAAAPAGEPAQTGTETRVVLDEAALDRLVAALEKAPLISVDTETDSLDPMRARLVGLSFSVEPGHAWYLPVGHDYLDAPAQLPWKRVCQRLRGLLEDPRRPKVGQHVKYDLNVLTRHGIAMLGVEYDTMLESYVLDAAGNRHDMDTLAEKYLGHRTIRFEEVAGKGKAQIGFNQVALEQAAPYAAEDADITLRLHQRLYPRVCEHPALKRVYHDIEIPLVPVLASMERTGVRIDAALLGQVSAELATRMEQLQARAWAESDSEFNLGSPKQLQTILYDKLQLPVLGKTPKGEPSTAESVLEELAAAHPLPRLILDWRALAKLRSTYADNLPRQVNPETGRIHTQYHQAVAATGRLSSSDPNLQNIPVRTAEGRRIRQAFVADDGNALLSIDYSQIELRLMAHLSGDARLQRAFVDGLDIHQATAAEVFGLELEAVDADRRRAAKAINFGLIYGMSAFGLARQLGIGRGDAQDYIDRFFARYPDVKRFMDDTRKRAHADGYVETLYGRRLYLPDIGSRNATRRQYAERTAINAPLQGTAADLIKCAMIGLSDWLQAHAPALRMTLQVHDELVFEGPEEELRGRAPELALHMCRVRKLDVPLVADWGVGPNWDAAHISGGHASSAD